MISKNIFSKLYQEKNKQQIIRTEKLKLENVVIFSLKTIDYQSSSALINVSINQFLL